MSLLAVCGSPTLTSNEGPEITPALWKRALAIPLRVVFFVPWCALVGAHIVIAPKYLEMVTPSKFHMLLPSLPSKGPRRFAYWAGLAHCHLFIFAFPLAVLAMKNPTLGLTVIALVATKALWEWKDFSAKMKKGLRDSIVMGHNDMESVYLALTKVYLEDGFEFSIDDEVITVKDHFEGCKLPSLAERGEEHAEYMSFVSNSSLYSL